MPNTDSEDFDWDNFEPASFKISELLDQELEDFDLLEKKLLKEGIRVLDNFSIDSNSSEFADWLRDILQLDEDEPISKEDYRTILELRLSRLRDYANLPSRTYNDNQVLKSIIIFFTVITSFSYSFWNSNLFNLIWPVQNFEKLTAGLFLIWFSPIKPNYFQRKWVVKKWNNSGFKNK